MTNEQYRSIRKELQYTQKEWAEMLGLKNIETVSRHENGSSPISKTLEILIKRIYQDEI